jgi:RNA polymerase sigma-70 factor (ECF subfamily)
MFKYEKSKKLGNEEFREIFLELYPDLCLYALKFLNDLDESKDIVQEVFARFWMENEKLQNKNLVRPYLYKSVKNSVLNYAKRERRKSPIDLLLAESDINLQEPEEQPQVDSLSFKDLQYDLEKAITELPEQRQRIFKMSRFQNMKHKEIAEALQISPKTVETQIYRSLSFLREKLKHYLE